MATAQPNEFDFETDMDRRAWGRPAAPAELANHLSAQMARGRRIANLVPSAFCTAAPQAAGKSRRAEMGKATSVRIGYRTDTGSGAALLNVAPGGRIAVVGEGLAAFVPGMVASRVMGQGWRVLVAERSTSPKSTQIDTVRISPNSAYSEKSWWWIVDACRSDVVRNILTRQWLAPDGFRWRSELETCMSDLCGKLVAGDLKRVLAARDTEPVRDCVLSLLSVYGFDIISGPGELERFLELLEALSRVVAQFQEICRMDWDVEQKSVRGEGGGVDAGAYPCSARKARTPRCSRSIPCYAAWTARAAGPLRNATRTKRIHSRLTYRRIVEFATEGIHRRIG